MNQAPRVLAVSGSPRLNSNTDRLLGLAAEGARNSGASVDIINVTTLNISPCKGCLRCNLLGHCSISDDWQAFAEKWKNADAIIFATPVYFHHITAQLKALLDRFRSFLKISMRESTLEYAALEYKPKNTAVILVQGHPSSDDFADALKFFEFFTKKVSGGSLVGHLAAKNLGVRAQIDFSLPELVALGKKMNWAHDHPEKLVALYDSLKSSARSLGVKLVESVKND